MPANNPSSHKLLLWGCIIPMGVILAFLLLLSVLMGSGSSKPPDYIKAAEDEVAEQLEQVEKKVKTKKQAEYDPDQTIMALFSIEKALKEAQNFEELTPFIVQQENDLIAPDVARLKYRFFNVYKKFLEAEDELSEHKSIYNITSGALLDIASMVGFDMTKGISFDREQAKQVWEKRLAGSKAEKTIKARLRKHQDEILDILFEYAKMNAKYIRKWDTLCSMRDRAYLALYEQNWDEVISTANSAVRLAPREKEAHILLAMALIERNKETDKGSAKKIINKFLEDNQGQQAPAYLLRGVIEFNDQDYQKANLDFEQAAAYFPKQQEEITNILNLYKKRQFLNKSKEGRMIINMYRGMMSGSGYFSPDFQMARIHIKMGEKEKAKKKIFDHFFRRRLQGQWDRVLMDFYFCKNYIDADFHEIFNGQNLTLEIEPAWLTNSLIVSIKNDNPTEIHNLTLLICVRFTDMFIGDYITFPVGQSVAVLPPGETVNVGRKNISDVTKEKLGTVKKWKDIIEYGAVLISDELIAWVAPQTRGPIQEPPPEEKEKEKEDNSKDKNKPLTDATKEKAKELLNKAIDSIGDE